MRRLAWLVAAAALAGATSAASPGATRHSGAELNWLRMLAKLAGERLWPGFGEAPFGFLVIEDEREVLLCRDQAPPGFTADGKDEATGCARYVRPRTQLPGNLLAAMPLFGPPSTIVMGPAPRLAERLPRWRSTVLHEHMHQWQAELPAYYERVKALDLSDGDQTGMWMLSFPFPYGDAAVQRAYDRAARALLAAVEARATPAFRDRLSDYLEARKAFAAAAGERNWRYFEFQLWAEGVPRWTEIALSRQSGDAAMIADAGAHERDMLGMLRQPRLAEHQRVAVYPFGMAEAMLMQACGGQWRAAYPRHLALGPVLEQAAASCRAWRAAAASVVRQGQQGH